MSKDAQQALKAPEPIPVPDIYSNTGKSEQRAAAKPATPEFHEPEGFDPYDTASLHRK